MKKDLRKFVIMEKVVKPTHDYDEYSLWFNKSGYIVKAKLKEDTHDPDGFKKIIMGTEICSKYVELIFPDPDTKPEGMWFKLKL